MSTSTGLVRLVLASASSRRVELLDRIGLSHLAMPADVDESVLPGETADDYVVRVASDKATAVAMALAAPPDSRSPDSRSLDAATDRGADSSGPTVVLAADTAVVLDGEPLGKPRDRADALAMLSRLSGRNHRVLSAVVVVDPDGVVHTALATATVTIAPLSSAELEWYVDSGEPLDKAGSYAIQGMGAALVESIDGDPTTVIGLPLRATLELLRAAGVQWPPTSHA